MDTTLDLVASWSPWLQVLSALGALSVIGTLLGAIIARLYKHCALPDGVSPIPKKGFPKGVETGYVRVKVSGSKPISNRTVEQVIQAAKIVGLKDDLINAELKFEKYRNYFAEDEIRLKEGKEGIMKYPSYIADKMESVATKIVRIKRDLEDRTKKD